MSFLPDGSMLILAAKHEKCLIQSFWVPEGATHAEEQTSRHWPYARLCSSVAGLVGYAGQEIAFFPAAAAGSCSSTQQVVGRSHQNILHCGEHLFLLCRGNWWHDAQLYADVLDLQHGTYRKMEITSMRDALVERLGDDAPQRQAVSATRDHFIFHVNTVKGFKLAAAVRLEKRPGGACQAAQAPCTKAEVSFAKAWPKGHPMAKLIEPDAWQRRNAAGQRLVQRHSSIMIS